MCFGENVFSKEYDEFIFFNFLGAVLGLEYCKVLHDLLALNTTVKLYKYMLHFINIVRSILRGSLVVIQVACRIAKLFNELVDYFCKHFCMICTV